MLASDAAVACHHVENRTILFGECDPAGILYTPRICEYIVESALRFLSDSLGEPFERHLFTLNLSMPARNLSVDFLRPLTWDDEIELRAGLSEMRTHALTIQVTAFDRTSKVAFSGRVTQVCTSRETHKLVRIPVELREALERR